MAGEGLAGIPGRLLIQCRPHQVQVPAGVAREWDAGLVLTGKQLEPVVRALRDGGFDGPVLCDADLGLIPLTDSGYIAARNITGLRTVLHGATRYRGPVVAVLPLAARWFATQAICEALVREINRFGVPVALAIEHSGDPFGAQRLVRWFLHLLSPRWGRCATVRTRPPWARSAPCSTPTR